MSIDPNIIIESFEAAKPSVKQIFIKIYAILFEDCLATQGQRQNLRRSRSEMKKKTSCKLLNSKDKQGIFNFRPIKADRWVTIIREKQLGR